MQSPFQLTLEFEKCHFYMRIEPGRADVDFTSTCTLWNPSLSLTDIKDLIRTLEYVLKEGGELLQQPRKDETNDGTNEAETSTEA